MRNELDTLMERPLLERKTPAERLQERKNFQKPAFGSRRNAATTKTANGAANGNAANRETRRAAENYKSELQSQTLLHEKEEIVYLRPEDLINDPRQPRDSYTKGDGQRADLSVQGRAALSIVEEAELRNFANELLLHGILQPIIARPPGSVYRDADTDIAPTRYQIIAGERRWRAAMLAGLERVPVIVRDVSPQTGLEWQIVENDQREDVTSRQRALGYVRLRNEFGYGINEIARKVSREESHVSTHINVFADDYLSGMVDRGELTLSEAVALLPLPDSYRPRLGAQISARRKKGITFEARRLQERVSAINKAIGFDRRRKGDFVPPRSTPLLNLDNPLPEREARAGAGVSFAQQWAEQQQESQSEGAALPSGMIAAATTALNRVQSGGAGNQVPAGVTALFDAFEPSGAGAVESDEANGTETVDETRAGLLYMAAQIEAYARQLPERAGMAELSEADRLELSEQLDRSIAWLKRAQDALAE